MKCCLAEVRRATKEREDYGDSLRKGLGRNIEQRFGFILSEGQFPGQ